MKIAIRVCLTVFAACMLSSLLANSASAQGCCKAGLCKIPQLPSSGANSSAAAAFADSMLNQNAMRDQTAVRPASSAAQSPAAKSPAAKGDVTEISLVNPVNSQAKIEYVLDGKTYALEPGMSLTVRTAQPRKIEFSRDQAGAKAAYRVSKGIYEFAMTDKGWELYRTQK